MKCKNITTNITTLCQINLFNTHNKPMRKTVSSFYRSEKQAERSSNFPQVTHQKRNIYPGSFTPKSMLLTTSESKTEFLIYVSKINIGQHSLTQPPTMCQVLFLACVQRGKHDKKNTLTSWSLYHKHTCMCAHIHTSINI